MAKAYVPIDCGLHDHLEVHAMRRDLLNVVFENTSGQTHRLNAVRLATWHSRDGEEIGVFVGGDQREIPIRLDRLRSVVKVVA